MENNDIAKAIQEYWDSQPPVQDRRITIRTGVGGMDLIHEKFQEHVGLYRIYLGKQIPRILRRLSFRIYQNYAGRYYKLLDKNNGKMVHNTARTEGEYS